MDSLIGVQKAAYILCLWALGLVFVSCENSFQHLPVSPEEVTGKYSGTISFDKFISYDGDTETVLKKEIELEFSNEQVSIPNFPVTTILSVIEKENIIGEIEKELGEISYQMGCVSQMGEDNSWVQLILSPEPLNFSYMNANGVRNEINVFMNTGVRVSHYESRQMQLKIIIEEIRVNGKPLFIIDEQYITFNVNKINGK